MDYVGRISIACFSSHFSFHKHVWKDQRPQCQIE